MLLLSKQWGIVKAILTWPCGKIKNGPRQVRSVHVMIAKKIFGAGNWEDAIKVLPVLNPKNITKAYNRAAHTFSQCRDGLQVLCNLVAHVDERGGFGFVDENTVVMKKAGEGHTLIEIIQKRLPFGNDGPTWQLHGIYLGVTVLRLCSPDKKFRLLFIYSPFCFVVHWSPTCTKILFHEAPSRSG